MTINNFSELKAIINQVLEPSAGKKFHPNLSDDFFDYDGKIRWSIFSGEMWKEGDVLYITFFINCKIDIFITIKIIDVNNIRVIDYKEEKTKQKIYQQAKEKNFPLVENYFDFKDNILEYTLNKSSIDNRVFFADQTTFLVDKYELYMRFVYETHELYNDKDEIELSGQLYIYAKNIQVIDTNIEGLEYEKN